MPNLLCEIRSVAGHKALTDEIKTTSPAHLRHVDAPNDRSSPSIPGDAHISKNSPHKELMRELQSASPDRLRHVELPSDRSAPNTQGAHVKKTDAHAKLMKEVSDEAFVAGGDRRGGGSSSAPLVCNVVGIKTT